MPIYEYECTRNGHRFEELQKISARPLQKCRVCGGNVRKLISPSAFSLQGGGWSKDGYQHSNGARKSESTESKGESSKDCSPSKCCSSECKLAKS
ncbi:MAG: zinc ribbon domain-containing protein [Pseudomonadota bacterium]